jgi:hypothetical protein
MSPAQAAELLGVTEADVIASLDAGDLKGAKSAAPGESPRRHRRVPRGIRTLHSHGGSQCAAKASLPGMRRGCRVEPSKKALACPYCGTILPWSDGEDPLGAAIVEHDLESRRWHPCPTRPAACRNRNHLGQMRKLPRHQHVRCRPRRAALRFLRLAVNRPHRQNLPDVITPESLLPAEVPSTQVRDQLRKWYTSRWFAPNKLKRAALTDTLHGIYLPYWTFDAHVDASWTAESGYYYYVTEQVRGSDGRTTSRRVRKTRWEQRSGSLSHFFDDDAVPGTVGVHAALLAQGRALPTLTDLKPYDPGLCSRLDGRTLSGGSAPGGIC